MNLEEIQGMIVESTGVIWSKTSIEDAWPMVILSEKEKSKTVVGVIGVPKRYQADGSLTWSVNADEEYDNFTQEFHVNSKPSDIEMIANRGNTYTDPCRYSSTSLLYKTKINSGGEGQVWVTNYNGELQNGDYVVSSRITGYGMLQDDDILRSCTVAKVTETIDWSKVTSTIIFENKTYKKVLVGCFYACD